MELTNGEFARHLLVAADMLDCADNSGNKIVPGIVRSMRKASGIITAYEETMGRLGLTPDELTEAAVLIRAKREGLCVVLPGEVSEEDRKGMADFLHDCFADWTHDPSVGLYGMTDGEAALANAIMALLTCAKAEAAQEGAAHEGN